MVEWLKAWLYFTDEAEGSPESDEQATMLRRTQLGAFVGTPALSRRFGPAVPLFHLDGWSSSLVKTVSAD